LSAKQLTLELVIVNDNSIVLILNQTTVECNHHGAYHDLDSRMMYYDGGVIDLTRIRSLYLEKRFSYPQVETNNLSGQALHCAME